MYVDRSIEISINLKATVVATENPFRQGNRIFLAAAVRAHLRCRLKPADDLHGSSVHSSLIFQLPTELIPTNISDRSAEFPIGNHPLHIEVFQTNHLVFVNKSGGDLVKPIAADVLDPGVKPCKFISRFFLVFGAFLLS
jgi:hypothetical protein